MTTVLREPLVTSPPSAGTVLLQLARFEARRALRHPLTWVGAIGALWMVWLLAGGGAPVLKRDSVYLAGAVLPLAAATLLVGNYAALRERRLADLLSAIPKEENTRLLGIQLGLIGPVILAMIIQMIGLIYLLLGGPIGEFDWWELAAGPAMVWSLGVGGVALARWLPHPAVAPVVVVGLAAIQLLASPDFVIASSEAAAVEWLAPWMMPSAFEPVEDFAGRPDVLHLLYLVAISLVLASVSLRLGRDAGIARIGVSVAFVGGVLAISLALPANDDEFLDWRKAVANQTCSTANGIEYCAFGSYEDWSPRWQEVVVAVDIIFPVEIVQVLQRPPQNRP